MQEELPGYTFTGHAKKFIRLDSGSHAMGSEKLYFPDGMNSGLICDAISSIKDEKTFHNPGRKLWRLWQRVQAHYGNLCGPKRWVRITLWLTCR